MNHKIQEIIGRECAQLLGALDSLKSEYGVSDFSEYNHRRKARVACASGHILRAVLEVIGEAGVEGALERLMVADAMWREAEGKWANAQEDFHGMDPRFKVAQEHFDAACKELTSARNVARTALRTLKELHQSLPARPSMRKITDDEAHDIAMRDAFGPEGQG